MKLLMGVALSKTGLRNHLPQVGSPTGHLGFNRFGKTESSFFVEPECDFGVQSTEREKWRS